MQDLNNLTITGRVVDEARTQKENDNEVAYIDVAVHGRKDSVDFITVKVYNGMVKSAKMLRKGKRISVAGRINTYKTKKNGTTYSNFNLIANNLNFIDYMGDEDDNSNTSNNTSSQKNTKKANRDYEVPF